MTSTQTLYPQLLATLKGWHKASIAPFQSWSSFRAVQAVNTQLSGMEGLRQAVKQFIETGLIELSLTDSQAVQIIRWRFLEGEPLTLLEVMTRLGEPSIDTVNRLQRKAVEALEQILVTKEKKAGESAATKIISILPAPSYSHFWGHQELRKNLIKTISEAAAPWITAITGIGGIGKTVLADQIVRAIYSQAVFYRFMWVQVTSFSLTGKQEPSAVWHQVQSELLAQTDELTDSSLSDEQQFRYLQQQFKSQPCLVVIDNIEDVTVVAYLLERLPHWTNPSHFILTSRARPAAQSGLAISTVEELNQADGLALLRYEAESLNLNEVAGAEDSALLPIYEVTGGNPLALKLVIGLASVMPLPVIMKNIATTPTGPIETMYRHIYRAAWQALSDEARTLLEIMPLISEVGAKPEQMQAVSELEDGPFWTAVRELVSRSLLEVRGGAWERRYGIHRLTQTFLQTEINSWTKEL